MGDNLKLGIGVNEQQALNALLRLTKQTETFAKRTRKSFSFANRAAASLVGNLGSRGLSAAFMQLNQAMRGTVTLAREVSKGFGEINTLLPENEKLTLASKDALVGFTSQFGSGIADQTKAFYQVVSAGVQGTNRQLNFVKQSSKAAVAGLASVEEAANLVTSQFNVFGKTGETVETIFDKVFATIRLGKTTFGELAQNLGQVSPFAAAADASLQEVLGTLAFLTKSGIKTDIAVRGLRQVFATVVKPSSEAKKAAEKLGIQFDTAALKSKGLARFLRDIAIAAKGDTRTLAELFQNIRALNPILAIVKGNFGDFKKVLNEVEDSAGATDRAFKIMEETFDFQLKRAGENFNLLATNVSRNFIPAMTEALKLFNSFAGTDTASKIDTLSKVFIKIGKAVNAFMIKPLEGFIALITSLDNIAIIAATNMVKGFLELGNMMTRVFGSKDTFNTFERAMAQLELSTVKHFEAITDKMDVSDSLDKFFQDVKDTANANSFARLLLEGGGTETVEEAFGTFFSNAHASIGPHAFVLGQSASEQFKEGLKFDPPSKEDFMPEGGEDDGVDSVFQSLNESQEEYLNQLDKTTNVSEKRIHSLAKTFSKFNKDVSKIMKNGLVNSMSSGFEAFGAALVTGENALEAFGKAMIKSIGQTLVQMGTRFIMEGIGWSAMPYAPGSGAGMIAAGAGMIVAGGAMGALVSGGSKGGNTGGGIGGGGLEPTVDDEITDVPEELQAERATNINVVVEGNVVDQDEFFVNMAEGLRDAIQQDGAVVNVRNVG